MWLYLYASQSRGLAPAGSVCMYAVCGAKPLLLSCSILDRLPASYGNLCALPVRPSCIMQCSAMHALVDLHESSGVGCAARACELELARRASIHACTPQSHPATGVRSCCCFDIHAHVHACTSHWLSQQSVQSIHSQWLAILRRPTCRKAQLSLCMSASPSPPLPCTYTLAAPLACYSRGAGRGSSRQLLQQSSLSSGPCIGSG